MTTKDGSPPSLLDDRSVGGLDAWGGFTGQLRYILVSVPRWLADAAFLGFQPERAEDVDAFFRGSGKTEVDYHQVKVGSQTPGKIKEYVKEFRERQKAALSDRVARRFVIATPSPNDDVRGAFVALARFRETVWPSESDAQRVSTLANLRTTFTDKGLVASDEDFNFVLAHMEVMHDWGGLEPAHPAWGRIAGDLGQLPAFSGMSVDDLTAAAKELAHAVDAGKRRYWSAQQVTSLLNDAIERRRAGPPASSGDIIFFCHQSRAWVATHPMRDVLPPQLSTARALRHTLTHAGLQEPPDWQVLPRELAAMFTPGNVVEEVVQAAKTSPVLYYGFPHIPLAALMGSLLGEQAHVHLVEHDRDTNLFAWPASPGPWEPLSSDIQNGDAGGAMVVRIAISAPVDEALCRVCTGEPVGPRALFGHPLPSRGVVVAERQARAYAGQIRKGLDSVVAGSTKVTSLHVFAAVPVSIAFLIGQILSSTGYCPAYVYNFRFGDTPNYHWALNLRRAGFGDGLVLPVAPPSTSGAALV